MDDLPHRVRLPDPRYINIAGVDTCYHLAGEGSETIVLIYGGNFGMVDPALSASEWGYNFAELAKKHRVLAFDKLGQGYTAAPLRDEDYTMGAVTAHAIGLLDALELGPAHIVGHSRGGVPALRIAMERPDLVRSLSVVCSSTLAPGVGLNEVTIGRPPFAPGTDDATRWVCERCCFQPDTVTEEWLKSSRAVLKLPSFQQGIKKMLDEQLATRLFIPDLAKYKRETFQMIEEGRLQRPTQVVWSANDPTAILERGIRLFEMLSKHERQVSLNVFNQAGHFPFAEHPAIFNAMLDRFIELHRT